MLTLSLIIEALTGILPKGFDREIHGVAIDSRMVRPGSMFVALPGERVDGHEFVQEAFNRGASVALVHQDLPFECFQYDLREG